MILEVIFQWKLLCPTRTVRFETDTLQATTVYTYTCKLAERRVQEAIQFFNHELAALYIFMRLIAIAI